jgi:hypothetical protein
MWWLMPVIPALRKLRQEDCEFELHIKILCKKERERERELTRTTDAQLWGLSMGHQLLEDSILVCSVHCCIPGPIIITNPTKYCGMSGKASQYSACTVPDT